MTKQPMSSKLALFCYPCRGLIRSVAQCSHEIFLLTNRRVVFQKHKRPKTARMQLSLVLLAHFQETKAKHQVTGGNRLR